MLGLLMAAVYFGYKYIFSGAEGAPLYLQDASWFLVWWYGIWGAIWAVIVGLGSLGIGGAFAVGGKGGTEKAAGVGVILFGIFAVFMIVLNYGLYLAAAYILSDAAPPGVTAWDQYDKSKCIVAGVLFFIGFVVKRLSPSSSSSKSSSDN